MTNVHRQTVPTILNSKNIFMLLGIAEKLRETLNVKIFRVGLERAGKTA